ncbi:MAG: isoprenyl transferase [Breznakibacter sp.]|nr:isoprenyl transferase [Breznakibacter sp.]
MESSIKEKLDKDKIPQHVAIIMDGNGRWAKKRGNARIFGHHNGVKSVREVTEASAELGIKFLTLYAFSTENWSRPKAEVDALMTLFVTTITSEVKQLAKNNVKLRFIGCIEQLPNSVQKKINESVEKTAHCTGLTLVLALSYSARWEILEAVKSIASQVKDGKLDVADIDVETMGNHLSTVGMPDPELLIRTSGEQRISNFLLWQLAYSELCFSEILWPDFRKEDFFKAIYAYQNRERRFGLTSEQI